MLPKPIPVLENTLRAAPSGASGPARRSLAQPRRAFRHVTLGLVALIAVTLSACQKPPATAYETTGPAATGAALAVGANTAGEACTSQPSAAGADVYCGNWDQPSAQIVNGGPAGAGDLASLATTSAWRAGLDGAYACGAPSAGTILNGVRAQVLTCTQRFGGWPHLGLVAAVNGTIWYADGVPAALPPMQRAIGVASGAIPASAAAGAAVASDQVLAQRLAAQAFSSGDIGTFEALMALGANANQAEDFPAAVIAYRAALALQQKKLGTDNPGTAGPMLELALNLSDEGQYPEAASLFAQAAARIPADSDPTASAKLLHYQGLDELNQSNNAAGLADLQAAAAAYAVLLPPELLQPRPAVTENDALLDLTHQTGREGQVGAQATLNSPIIETALLGVIETRRYQAIALQGLGQPQAASAALKSADAIAQANDITPPMLGARLARTGAALDAAAGRDVAADGALAEAAADFSTALPGSRPVAETDLLQAPVLTAEHKESSALATCRAGIALLNSLRIGASASLIAPCLDAFAAAADQNPAQAARLHKEMFAAAELAQGSVTAQEIAEAAARLASSSSNPAVAGAIRAQQDAAAHLADLYNQRDAYTKIPSAAAQGVTLASLDKQIAAAQANLRASDLALQAAAPNFGQLVQQVVPADDVLNLLRPDEAFLGITSTPDHTWLFLLHNHTIDVARGGIDDAAMANLVAAVRASIEPTAAGLPSYDMADAGKIYHDTLGPFAADLPEIHELVVAPSGPLLALPFALLPTGPADPANLAAAPWLVRDTSLAYVPAAANFVALRKIETTSAATQPWFGFGDFQPVSLAQAQATYNPATCANSAAEFSALPDLPYAKLELAAGAAVFGASPADELLGPDFTVPNVEAANLKNFRILHFATHALLPTDLPCQDSPAIVTSAPPGAASAADALLTTADVAALKLDANLVVLSACNTGGGAAGGEALSGLARSFFYAGARALMVTQWSVNDQVSAYLVADTLERVHDGSAGGAAGSLRAAQLALIAGAGHGLAANVANPFFWAAFAVIGDGGAAAGTQLSALSGTADPGL